MGIAEKIHEVVKDLPEPQAAQIPGFAESGEGTHRDGCSCPATH
jgi:hypothetical protein